MSGARIDESHRKELLRFLLVKTAAVRRGVKPAELLRVRHCYSGVNSEGLRVRRTSEPLQIRQSFLTGATVRP